MKNSSMILRIAAITLCLILVAVAAYVIPKYIFVPSQNEADAKDFFASAYDQNKPDNIIEIEVVVHDKVIASTTSRDDIDGFVNSIAIKPEGNNRLDVGGVITYVLRDKSRIKDYCFISGDKMLLTSCWGYDTTGVTHIVTGNTRFLRVVTGKVQNK